MYEPTNINIPATKTIKDVYIIRNKKHEATLPSAYKLLSMSNLLGKFERNGYEVDRHGFEFEDDNGVYYCEKGIQEVYTITMPTKEQSKTITYYGSNGLIVTPYKGLVYIDIDEAVKKIDWLNNAKARNLMRLMVYNYMKNKVKDYSCINKTDSNELKSRRGDIKSKLKEILETVTMENFAFKLEELSLI